MKRGLVFSMLGLGVMASTANAGILSMRFAGGGTEITLGASQSVTVEVLFAMNSTDKATNRLTGIDSRFEVGSLIAGAESNAGANTVPGYRAETIQNGSTKLTVTGVATPITGWNTDASILGTFNGDGFFLSAGSTGAIGPVGNGQNQPAQVIATFVIHKTTTGVGDTFVAFRSGAALPALSNGAAQWSNRFGYNVINAGQQFEFGQGNPGDARPQDTYHGYEVLQPLVIHQVPEPSALAMLAVGGLAMLRRRK